MFAKLDNDINNNNNDNNEELNILENKNNLIEQSNVVENKNNLIEQSNFVENKNNLIEQSNVVENKNNLTETNTTNENIKSQDELSKLIKDIPLNNLNDYYDIETNLFKKKIEKLNLKFYWIYESFIGEDNNNLLYPYNKLFLILFKEISLYIEEILRLNKQLTLKNKNEKFYLQKINDYKKKEKDFLQNKLIIKNLERNTKTLEKHNEKLKNDLERMSKKLFNINIPSFSNNSNYTVWRNNLSNKGKLKNNSKGSNKNNIININEQGSVLSSGSNKVKNRIYINKKNRSKEIARNITNNNIHSNNNRFTKTTNVSNGNNNKDFIYLGINQCDEEIKNLNLIENLLINCYENYNKNKLLKRKKNQSYKMLSPERSNINKNQPKLTSYKKKLFKTKIKTTDSIDYKAVDIINEIKFK